MFFSTFPDGKFIFSYVGCGLLKSAPFLVQFCVGPLKVVKLNYKQEYKVTYLSINQAFLFLKKKKKVPSNTFTERKTQEKEETTQRQSVKTCDMKIVIHTHKKNKNNTHGRGT